MKKYLSLLFAALILSASYVSADVIAEESIGQENPAGDETEKTDDNAPEETVSCDIVK